MCLSANIAPMRTDWINDEGACFGFDNRVWISSHRKLLWSKAIVVNVAESRDMIPSGTGSMLSAIAAGRSMIPPHPKRLHQGRDDMTSRHLRQRPISLLHLLLGAAAAAVATAAAGTQDADAQSTADAAAACAKLATFSNFPVAATQITLAKFNARGSTSASAVALPDHCQTQGNFAQIAACYAAGALPNHCQVQGIINKRVGVDGYPYGDSFEVRLPAPADWNGRFMFQGGGGTEGALPPAVGIAGTLSPALAHGWAVASQDGG